MPTWDEIGAKNARESNERMRQEANARVSIAPINEVNQTLKEIKALLIEIRNIINNENLPKVQQFDQGWATLGIPIKPNELL